MMLLPLLTQAQTLEECQQAAEKNYPLIRQYDLISKTTELTVSNMAKGWLPQISAYAQATLQSDVTAWPDKMQTMMQQTGIELKGLKKDQYRIGIDIQQTVFDGGAIKYAKETARQKGIVEATQTEVTLYGIRKRVNEMYFALLLLNEHLRLNDDLNSLLQGNEKKLEAMVKRGTAAESDWQSMKAERLNVAQQRINLASQQQMLKTMLSAFCGIEVTTPVKPVKAISAMKPTEETATLSTAFGQRPELRAIDAQLRLADAQERTLNAGLMPRLSVFAQGFYGYPGYNMFEDMMHHRWSWNGMVGARLTWNIGALYTRHNDRSKIQQQRSMAETNREVFLFNNRLEEIQENETINRYRQLMTDDEEIISLRSEVRKAAESKLQHGIIDVNDLVKEINNENAAKVQQSLHEIEMLKAVCELKYITNN